VAEVDRESTAGSTYERGGVEFARVLAFSDGLFAIAMTLLVVGIAVPTLDDGSDVGELADALNDLTSNFISFFISFAVIGRYWVAHHALFSQLARMDGGLIGLNLVYLAFIAFLPFPTALLGIYIENPLSVGIYALIVAIISGLEVVLFDHAREHGLLRHAVPDDVYRWGRMLSLSPVVFFALSIPVAFISTTLAVATWFLFVPFSAVAQRWKPERADEFF
jgi:TMEM175 potassium channel family protein